MKSIRVYFTDDKAPREFLANDYLVTDDGLLVLFDNQEIIHETTTAVFANGNWSYFQVIPHESSPQEASQ